MLNQLQSLSNLLESTQQTKPKYTAEQDEFINYRGSDSIILSATAGSGKTHSCVGRLKELLNRGVKPEEIIFFSFTTDAVGELKERIKNDKIKITTIHAFCFSILSKFKKFKEIADFYQFIHWYKNKNGQKFKSAKFESMIERMYDDCEKLSSDISTYKLLRASNVKARLPEFTKEYQEYLKLEKKRDFADMLIEVRALSTTDKWKAEIAKKYKYVFVDEYQDTSLIQMQILSALSADYYCLVGDRNQSIYNFSGSNCGLIERELKSHQTCIHKNLSVNFRSDISIVENSNKWSSLTAIPNSTQRGQITFSFLDSYGISKVLQEDKEVAILVRTNHIIRELEFYFLKQQIPLRYFNYITPQDIESFHNGKFTPKIKNKFLPLLGIYGTEENLIGFIESNKDKKQFITTIHKSKGREYDTCIVVNSFSPDVMKCNEMENVDEKLFKRISFNPDDIDDFESKNIHYVAVTRPKHKLYFSYIPENGFEI